MDGIPDGTSEIRQRGEGARPVQRDVWEKDEAYAGFLVFLLGIGAAVFATSIAGARQESSRWLIVLAAVLLLGGMQMSMMGMLGEYLWRTLIDSRRRPQYLIEETVGFPAGVAQQTNYQAD